MAGKTTKKAPAKKAAPKKPAAKAAPKKAAPKAVETVTRKGKPVQVAVDGKANDVVVRKTSGMPAPPRSGVTRPRTRLTGK